MHYLKAIAQDLHGNGHADTVILHFYQQRPGRPDELIYDIVGQEMTLGAKWGGHSKAGALDLDKRRIATFADNFLKLNWFNTASYWQRSLVLYVDDFGEAGWPASVTLEFRESKASGGKALLVSTAMGYDIDSDGVLETFTHSDIDHNGVADKADKALLRTLCKSFLAFEWYETKE
ncbi:hypothetical protein PseBG33_5318 [Pseudomonas synxantha BG33R]|uniref:hypothetical protein n=1 Tax=Pseudomonas TaxID=286 RepID=UPI00025FFD23|nr:MULTISPECIES: hypothetical protein [Pseudomonas]EIK73471.1 hypothetical protein PseBG33_5318 [Pseudomonas synxantha BG33R]QOY71345.1 hypothetical protein IH404_26995 [Pseudomonas sp. OST1909]WPN54232.1 hypothetical protein QMK52_08775 [Pseudomonas sp. P9_2]